MAEHKSFNMYFAVGSRQYLWLLYLMNVKNCLISFAYQEPYKGKLLLKQHEMNVMLDSGAFTAWSKGIDVNIDEYIEFYHQHKELISRVVSLDVIPGSKGNTPTKEQRDKSCEQGWQNYEYMKKQGVPDPIHVFHQFDDWEYLDRMLDHCKYIGVSPANDQSTKSKIAFMDNAFRHIRNSKNPNIKTHGFAVTSPRMVSRYPWYSVDSSAWALTSANGVIITPSGRLTISDEHKSDPDYIDNKPVEIQQVYKEYIEQFGFSWQMPKKNYKYRNIINIWHYLQLEKKIQEEGAHEAYLDQKTMFDVHGNIDQQAPKKSPQSEETFSQTKSDTAKT